MKQALFATLFLPLTLLSNHVAATEFSWSGFATVAGGKILSSPEDEFALNDFHCPCLITDYNQGAAYEQGDFDFKPESRVGIQGTVKLTDKLDATGQAVGRATSDSASMEWAYISYKLSPKLTLQAGRKRIPLYYYSDFQDVGQAYMWVRPPQALYGWEASNYNGLSIRYSGDINGWGVMTSLFTGSEKIKESRYLRIYDNSALYDIKWDKIIGGDIEISNDWLTARVILMSSRNYVTESGSSFEDSAIKQSVGGLALNADFGNWFVLTETNINRREADTYTVRAPANLISAGYRIGKFTPFLSWSRYWDKSTNVAEYAPERFTDKSFTLRYDINSSMDAKLQLDELHDHSVTDFVGTTKSVSIALDVVF